MVHSGVEQRVKWFEFPVGVPINMTGKSAANVMKMNQLISIFLAPRILVTLRSLEGQTSSSEIRNYSYSMRKCGLSTTLPYHPEVTRLSINRYERVNKKLGLLDRYIRVIIFPMVHSGIEQPVKWFEFPVGVPITMTGKSAANVMKMNQSISIFLAPCILVTLRSLEG